MTRVEFYDGGAGPGDDPLAIVLRLAAKASAAGERALILADDAAQARRLDERLWAVGDDVFVAHALADDPDADAADVLIAVPGQPATGRAVVFNLRAEAIELDCERLVELIPLDEAGKQAARARWRAYQARGLKPVKS